jgi:hypothetical protein
MTSFQRPSSILMTCSTPDAAEGGVSSSLPSGMYPTFRVFLSFVPIRPIYEVPQQGAVTVPRRLLMIEMPPIMAAFFSATESNAVARCFTADAIVRDERRQHRGVHEIEAWHRDVVARRPFTERPVSPCWSATANWSFRRRSLATFPAAAARSTGFDSIAHASDAHDASTERFSATVISTSRTTSSGCRNALNG